MKKISKVLPLIIVIFLFLPFGCKKVNESRTEDENLQTDELAKIDSTYKKVATKFEGDDDKPKIETLASPELRDRIRSELEKSYSKQISYLKSAGNLVGVFSSYSCGSYLGLTVNMDCEDHRPASSSSGWTGASYVTYPAKNVILNFCVVDNSYFQRTDKDYAVLMLTANLPSGVDRICRYFDNENDSNGNWTLYNNANYSGWFGNCYFGTNTWLAFYYYPRTTTYTAFPYLGMDYGLLGNFGQTQLRGNIITDDEDTNNTNQDYWDQWNGSGWTRITFVSIPNIMYCNGNTQLFLSEAQW